MFQKPMPPCWRLACLAPPPPGCLTVPLSYDILLENFLDPAHVPHSHHGVVVSWLLAVGWCSVGLWWVGGRWVGGCVRCEGQGSVGGLRRQQDNARLVVCVERLKRFC